MGSENFFQQSDINRFSKKGMIILDCVYLLENEKNMVPEAKVKIL
jgi:hypothetical protein